MTLAAPRQFDPEQGGMAACAACAVVPSAKALAGAKPDRARLMLSLPAAHCAACISTVESALLRAKGVRSARVNLTLKRVSVDATAEVTAADLVAVLKRVGYEAHELDAGLLSSTETDRQGRDLLMRLGVAFFSMMNVMLLSVAVWSGAEAATRDMFHWISALIAIPTVIFAGRPFFRSAYASLSAGRLGMDVPISLALILASSISLVRDHQGRPSRLFRRRRDALLLPAARPLSRPPHPRRRPLCRRGTRRARSAARLGRDRDGRGGTRLRRGRRRRSGPRPPRWPHAGRWRGDRGQLRT